MVAGTSLALTAGPLVGGGLIAPVGWRSIFLVNLPIGLADLWLTSHSTKETARSSEREIHLFGQLAAIAVLGCLAGALIEGGAAGWSSPLVIAGFIASVVLVTLFVLQEWRALQPMLPLSLFRRRMLSWFWLSCLIILLMGTVPPTISGSPLRM